PSGSTGATGSGARQPTTCSMATCRQRLPVANAPSMSPEPKNDGTGRGRIVAMPTIKEITDLGDDRIRVTIRHDDGSEVEGEGWLSAISNHYDPDSYGPDGHLRP